MAINFTPSELKKVEGRSREDLEAELKDLTEKTLTRLDERKKVLIEQTLSKMRRSEASEPRLTDLKESIVLRSDQKVKSDTPGKIFDNIHSSNSDAPDNIKTETPKGFKSDIQLKDHQKTALTWMLYRENSNPRGGILADDMGLGKTMSMIALILHQKNARDKSRKQELNDTFKNDPNILPCFSTLIIAPKSLIYHWEQEIKDHVNSGVLNAYVYYDKQREEDPKILGNYDVVITTYGYISSELKDGRTNSVFVKIGWERIILDEAQEIKNPKTHKAICCSRIPGLSRWALSGTPIQNNLNDLYSLVKFLGFEPFNDENIWKLHVVSDAKKTNGKVNALVKFLLIRRTKDQRDLITGNPIIELTVKKSSEVWVNLQELERKCYDALSTAYKNKAKTILDEKNTVKKSNGTTPSNKTKGSNSKSPSLKNKSILAIILRLRQACLHMSMLKDAIDSSDLQEETGKQDIVEDELPSLDSYAEVFDPDYLSAKMIALFKELDQVIEDGHKCVVVSQWLKPLTIIASHLKKKNILYTTITGEIDDRQNRVNAFNQKKKGPQVMLLSLTAGGVGLNLIGGNHLFLMDLHWNPAREQQASDRIYRIGQEKNVFIHKFICNDTIENNILDIQNEKTKLAEDVFKGAEKLSPAQCKKLLGI